MERRGRRIRTEGGIAHRARAGGAHRRSRRNLPGPGDRRLGDGNQRSGPVRARAGGAAADSPWLHQQRDRQAAVRQCADGREPPGQPAGQARPHRPSRARPLRARAGPDPSMSAARRTRDLGFENAEARLAEHLREDPPGSPGRRAAVLLAAAVLFAVVFAARLAVHDPAALLANFYIVPIAILAIEFGTPAGIAGAACALGLVFAWSAIETVHVDLLGYSSRTAAFVVTGVVVGSFSQRLRQDIVARQRAQRHLAVYADQLERANHQLASTVEQLEAFAEIARAVGGETELRRVLSLILEHGRGIVPRRLVVYLREDEELVAVSGPAQTPEDRDSRLPVVGSLPGEVLRGGRARRCAADDARLAELDQRAASAILVPLVFRGETLGVLAGIDLGDGRRASREDEDEDEQ